MHKHADAIRWQSMLGSSSRDGVSGLLGRGGTYALCRSGRWHCLAHGTCMQCRGDL